MKKHIKIILDSIGLLKPLHRMLLRLGMIEGHGHELLIRMLRREHRRQGTAMKGRWLVEIGSTREKLPGQGSTAQLAAICQRYGLHFTTVDMDPENTHQAAATLARFGNGFEAVNMKGEDFLASCERIVHYCYLDAFDIDHGHHSVERQRRYEEHLGVSIENELCWKMHLDCARALVERMPKGGIVVFDDSWWDGHSWQGKGHLAIPYLLEQGFEIVISTRNAVALERRQ
ncbi:MAG: hypothetical protein D6694_11375 [Gammaproteobacteria bacterium]|nr:MAG: hypothetical protein D6694_11375 [Gammaproteobacteria bacterium]